MGFFSTIKGWLNIGGVKVKLEDLSQVIPKDGNKITAKVNLTTKDAKTVNKVLCKFLLKKTTGSGESKETKEYVIAQRVVTDAPFELAAGESKVLPLDMDYALAKTLADLGGVLGGLGKAAKFLSSTKEEYYVVAQADVKGAAVSPSHWVSVTIK